MKGFPPFILFYFHSSLLYFHFSLFSFSFFYFFIFLFFHFPSISSNSSTRLRNVASVLMRCDTLWQE